VRIDQDVDGAGQRLGARHHLLHFLQLRHIALHRPGLCGFRQLRGDFGEARAVDVGDHHLGSFALQRGRDHAAEAAGTPGHQGGSVFK
jgi:hypothetical protein